MLTYPPKSKLRLSTLVVFPIWAPALLSAYGGGILEATGRSSVGPPGSSLGDLGLGRDLDEKELKAIMLHNQNETSGNFAKHGSSPSTKPAHESELRLFLQRHVGNP